MDLHILREEKPRESSLCQVPVIPMNEIHWWGTEQRASQETSETAAPAFEIEEVLWDTGSIQSPGPRGRARPRAV